MEEENMQQPLKLTCKQCGHSWFPRSESPTYCPRCYSRAWSVDEPLTPKEFRKKPLKSSVSIDDLRRKLRGNMH